MREILVDVAPDGTPTVTVKGIKGAACSKATEALEKALGGEVVKRTATAEMKERPQHARNQAVNKA